MSFSFCPSLKENWRFVSLQVTLSFVFPPLFFFFSFLFFKCQPISQRFPLRIPFTIFLHDLWPLRKPHVCSFTRLDQPTSFPSFLTSHLPLFAARLPLFPEFLNATRRGIYGAAGFTTLHQQSPVRSLKRSLLRSRQAAWHARAAIWHCS